MDFAFCLFFAFLSATTMVFCPFISTLKSQQQKKKVKSLFIVHYDLSLSFWFVKFSVQVLVKKVWPWGKVLLC